MYRKPALQVRARLYDGSHWTAMPQLFADELEGMIETAVSPVSNMTGVTHHAGQS